MTSEILIVDDNSHPKKLFSLERTNFIPQLSKIETEKLEGLVTLDELTQIPLTLGCILIKESYLFLWILFSFRALTLFSA